jgi:predicted MFS family arabinose efflux permease
MPPTQQPTHLALLACVFGPFAAGYFFSFMLRNINAIVFPELVAAFNLGPDALGILTSAYFFAFAAFQIPLGLLLDRFGPRRVNASLLLVAGCGTVVFALASNFAALVVGRALMGLGFCGCLMASMTAFVLWFPRSTMATLSGCMIAVGAIGALLATTPVEIALRSFDWRAVFGVLAVLVFAAAMLIFWRVPEKAQTAPRTSVSVALVGLAQIARDPSFWRIGLLAALTQAGGLALLGLWAGPWLRDLAGLERAAIAEHLFAAALAFGVGGILFGTLSDRLALRGVKPRSTFLAGSAATTALLVPLALGITWQPMLLWSFFTFCAASGTLAYPLLSSSYPVAMTGRILTAVNVLTMACAFLFQAGVGAVIGLWPAVNGRYDPSGYALAFGLIFVLQLASLLWAALSPSSVRKPSLAD